MEEDEASSENGSWRPWAIIGLGVAVLLLVGVVLHKHNLQEGAGAAQEAIVLSTPEGRRLLLLDEAVGVGEDPVPQLRATLVRLETGTRLARKVLPSRADYLGASEAGLWFDEPGGEGLLLLDARTLEALRDEEALLKLNPELRQGLATDSASRVLDAVTGELHVMTRDGHRYVLAGRELRARPFEGTPPHHRDRGSPTTSYARVPGREPVDLVGSPRQRLSRPNQDVAQAPSYLKASLLVDSRTHALIAPDNPEGYVLAHQDVLEPKPTLQLSRVRPDGTEVWRSPREGQREVLGALVEGDLLLVVTRGPEGHRDEVVALGLADGQERWRYRF